MNLIEFFDKLCDIGVECRFHPDTHEALFRPPPKKWPDPLRATFRAQKIEVVRALTPHQPGGKRRLRKYWRPADGLEACIGCGKSTATRDPLDQPRHAYCGWLGQRPDYGPQRAARAAQLAAGAPVPAKQQRAPQRPKKGAAK